MWKILCLVAVAIISIAEGCTYKDAECPEYTVVEEHADYEVRKYPAITWATTFEVQPYRRFAAFSRLFSYISGENDRKEKMYLSMTLPLRLQTSASEIGVLYGMGFMVPSEFALDPPRPDNDSIHIVREEETLYAVRNFKGYFWTNPSILAIEAQKLAESVKDDETVDKTSYYVAIYDTPDVYLNRRDEIWMVKKIKQETNEA